MVSLLSPVLCDTLTGLKKSLRCIFRSRETFYATGEKFHCLVVLASQENEGDPLKKRLETILELVFSGQDCETRLRTGRPYKQAKNGINRGT